MFIQLFIVTLVMWLFVIRWNNRHKRKLAGKIRNKLKSWPVVGHAHFFLGSNEDRMKAFCELGQESIRCGGSTCIWLFNRLLRSKDDEVFATYIKWGYSSTCGRSNGTLTTGVQMRRSSGQRGF